MTANKLPPDVRSQILDAAKSQLGLNQYQSLVDQVGEDGIISAVLATPIDRNASKPRSLASRLMRSPLFIFLVLVPCVVGCLNAYFPLAPYLALSDDAADPDVEWVGGADGFLEGILLTWGLWIVGLFWWFILNIIELVKGFFGSMFRLR